MTRTPTLRLRLDPAALPQGWTVAGDRPAGIVATYRSTCGGTMVVHLHSLDTAAAPAHRCGSARVHLRVAGAAPLELRLHVSNLKNLDEATNAITDLHAALIPVGGSARSSAPPPLGCARRVAGCGRGTGGRLR